MKRALFLAALLFACTRPLEADLPGYDDAYYARKALEVARGGGWLALPWNGAPTFDNPPIGIWSQSLVFLVLGPSDAAARLPTAIYGVLTVLLVYSWVRRRLPSPQIAVAAAAVFLCNPLYLKYLRRGMLDVCLLFFCVAGAWLAERKPLSRLGHAASGVLFGMAFLTKSLLALTFPLALAAGWALEGAEGRRRLRTWALPALCGFGLVVGTWAAVMAGQFGELFVRGHFGWLLWQEGARGISDTSRVETLLRALALMSPAAIIFMVAARTLARGVKSQDEASGSALALGMIPIAFVLGLGPRKLWYFLPALPGLSLGAGLGLARWMEGKAERQDLTARSVLGALAAGALAIFILPIPLHRDRTAEVRAVAGEIRARTQEGAPLTLFFPGEKCRWDVRNAILWYADRPIQGCAGETPEQPMAGGVRPAAPSAAAGEAPPGRRWVVTTAAGTAILAQEGRAPEVWFERGELRLVSIPPRGLP